MEYKICVYAIAKNEIKFVDRFFNSVKEADYVCVLDTGSTDGTFERFKELDSTGNFLNGREVFYEKMIFYQL